MGRERLPRRARGGLLHQQHGERESRPRYYLVTLTPVFTSRPTPTSTWTSAGPFPTPTTLAAVSWQRGIRNRSGSSRVLNRWPPADQGFSTSSNGFPGFPAATSGTNERDNYAVYVDAEWTPTDRLVTQAAIRFEDFDDFGSTTNYKVGWTRSPNFGIRSTYSTGFKAPTPGQANASNTSTELINVNGVPRWSTTARFRRPARWRCSRRQAAWPAESTNFTAGIYATLGNFEIRVDYYDIDEKTASTCHLRWYCSGADRSADRRQRPRRRST